MKTKTEIWIAILFGSAQTYAYGHIFEEYTNFYDPYLLGLLLAVIINYIIIQLSEIEDELGVDEKDE